MARLLACLRIAASVAVRFARLAFGWWGFTLPTRSRTGWVAYSWFLSLSHALILHVPFCLVALPLIVPWRHLLADLPTEIAYRSIDNSDG